MGFSRDPNLLLLIRHKCIDLFGMFKKKINVRLF